MGSFYLSRYRIRTHITSRWHTAKYSHLAYIISVIKFSVERYTRDHTFDIGFILRPFLPFKDFIYFISKLLIYSSYKKQCVLLILIELSVKICSTYLHL